MRFPEYIISGDVAVRLEDSTGSHAEYWREAGAWGISINMEDGKLIARDNDGQMKDSNGSEWKECTKEEWQKSNARHGHQFTDLQEGEPPVTPGWRGEHEDRE